jgi:hypothetical protein
MAKKLWRERNDQLDPETDYVEIVQNLALYEFTWDITQALSFALFRTYAVPSVGRLLDETGRFTTACQKRYDDTALLLEAPFVHGFDSEEGKTAIRRINQMHKMYDISNDDMRYVLSTFVVVPKRWLDDYGWRPLTERELRATVNYYRDLGRHMGIKDIPETYDEFMHLMDDYERQHFAFDEGGRRVADATLDLMTTFYPRVLKKPVDLFSRSLMDKPLLPREEGQPRGDEGAGPAAALHALEPEADVHRRPAADQELPRRLRARRPGDVRAHRSARGSRLPRAALTGPAPGGSAAAETGVS